MDTGQHRAVKPGQAEGLRAGQREQVRANQGRGRQSEAEQG